MTTKKETEQIVEIFKVMSHPTRVAILIFLKKPCGRCFEEIRRKLNLNNNTASFHLKKLVDVRLIVNLVHGKYHLTDFGKRISSVFEDFDKAVAEMKK